LKLPIYLFPEFLFHGYFCFINPDDLSHYSALARFHCIRKDRTNKNRHGPDLLLLTKASTF
jgi:hypothetical protein